MNRKLDIDFERIANLMREVGFTDVVLRPFKIPVGCESGQIPDAHKWLT